MKGIPVFAIVPRRSLDTPITARTAISRRNGQNYLHGPPSVIKREPFMLNPPSFSAAGAVDQGVDLDSCGGPNPSDRLRRDTGRLS
jgi:hypothetical protein